MSDTVDEIELNELYRIRNLPDNEMNKSGKLEWVNDDTLALVTGGMVYEFEMAAECTLIAEVDANGEVQVVDEVAE